MMLYVALALLSSALTLAAGAQCRTTNDHKNYTCIGFPFRQLSASRNTRAQLLRVRIYDCKETRVEEDSLRFPAVENLTISCDLSSFHENAFRNLNHLKELDLGNNTISAFPDGLFSTLSELRTLNLSNNNFERIARNTFDGLTNLKQLILSRNSISDFDLRALAKSPGLEELCLHDNRIEIVPAKLLSRNRKLRALDLAYNSIEALGDVFTETSSLEYLNLSHNAIGEIPAGIFQGTRLKVLDVSYNELEVVYEDTLKLDTLEKLYLQNNRITLLEVKRIAFNRVPLNFLDVRNNRLVFLEDDFILSAKKLEVIRTEGNPWDCNCYGKLEGLREDLVLEVSPQHQAGELPLCVVSSGAGNGCDIDKSNLHTYYNIYKELLEPRK